LTLREDSHELMFWSPCGVISSRGCRPTGQVPRRRWSTIETEDVVTDDERQEGDMPDADDPPAVLSPGDSDAPDAPDTEIVHPGEPGAPGEPIE
jgi:hypothetical protein